jgi:hypothetical protein
MQAALESALEIRRDWIASGFRGWDDDERTPVFEFPNSEQTTFDPLTTWGLLAMCPEPLSPTTRARLMNVWAVGALRRDNFTDNRPATFNLLRNIDTITEDDIGCHVARALDRRAADPLYTAHMVDQMQAQRDREMQRRAEEARA